MIVVTGAAGFIGSVLLKHINDLGFHEILCIDKLGSNDKWKNLLSKQFVDIVDYDFTMEALEQYKNQIETVVHLGACSSTLEVNMDYLLNNNYRNSQKIYLWCQQHHVRFLYASSASTYGDGKFNFPNNAQNLRPLNKYGYSKYLFDCWQLRNESLVQCVGLKFFNVYGPNEYHKTDMASLIYKFYQDAIETGNVRIFGADGSQKRDFVYVKDVVEVILYFIQHPSYSGIYDVGSGVATDFQTTARIVMEKLNLPLHIEYAEMPSNLKDSYQWYTKADLKNLRTAGYEKSFTPLEEGIEEYICYLTQGLYI